MATATLRPLLRAPSGYRMAYVAAPCIAVGDTFVFVLKDLWAAESPLRREVAEPELLVPRLEAIHDLAFHVVPPGLEDRRSFEPASYVTAPDGTIVLDFFGLGIPRGAPALSDSMVRRRPGAGLVSRGIFLNV